MTIGEILQMAQTLSVVLAIVVAFGTLRNRTDDKATELAEMKIDIKYIKEKIGGLGDLRDRVICVEASSKQAHKRIDDHLRNDHNKTVRKDI